ncbi:C-GCAxxG-C-C family protein [uncultured Sphaerochaeta sp.]|uniref:C-GCAxxG-C-C family protein n=1 Tax=uncultured Sphaerochaeta sp. TaxID=886478 RepID=UPI002A0A9320|nr:C-GCAxxG-C-C family protein [uncultured Sphaerochaeta sp.]
MEKSYVDRAQEYHESGYNCAQSVACAFLPILSIDEPTLFSVMEGFGAGMGGMEATCGALSGAVAVASLLTSSGSVENLTKVRTYELSKELVSLFQEKNHSLVCKELRGIESGIPLRSCPLCIEDAVLLVQQVLHLE